MNLRKEGCPRLNINGKDRGQAEWVAGLFFLLILSVLMAAQLKLAAWRHAAVYLEDALAASNLASALIDVEEYGRSHAVLIADVSTAYAVYLDAVRDNLQLNGQWECGNQSLIAGPVEIVDYVIYNVRGEQVDAVRVARDGTISERQSGVRGVVKAPNGVTVECTGIYSEIQFPVEGFPGVTVQAHKGKLVDIVSEEGEADEE